MGTQEFHIEEFKIDDEFEKQGGQAKVFKGLHSTYGEVAIKQWLLSSDDMEKEMKLLQKNACHHNIIQLLGILMNDKSKRIGYVMPYMPMESLGDGKMVSDLIILLVIHNKAEKYDQKQIKSWITQICYGLAYLHLNRIIHRDIKPSNVLLGRCYDEVKLSDFGISRSLKDINRILTTGRGSPVYMAPELFKGENYDLTVDIYSLSITIWEILYRRIPYDHVNAKSLFDLQMKISDGIRPKLENDLSEAVTHFLTRCWHNDSSKRPTVDYIREFSSKTAFLCTNPEDSVNECVTSFKNFNVNNNNNNNETLSKTITGNEFEILEDSFLANNAESTNAPKKLTVNHTRGNHLFYYIKVFPAPNNSESFSQIPLITPNPVAPTPEKQTILLLGGIDGMGRDSLLILENDEQNWKQLNIKLPYPIRNHGAQFFNNNLYMFGGYVKGNCSNRTVKLSKSLKWEKMAYMNQRREYILNSSVILNNEIWVMGGDDEKHEALKSVEMYNPLTNKWRLMKEMNQCRANAAAAVVNGKILYSGGWNAGNDLNSVECYDPSSDVWTLVCNMPQSIEGHGAVEIDGNFVVIGGSNRGWNGKCLNTVWALSTRDNNPVWIEKPPMSILRKDFSMAKVDGKTFVCGGETGEDNRPKAIDLVEIFDGKVWRNGPKMPTPYVVAPAVVIPTKFARDLEQFIPEPWNCSIQ